MAQKKTQEEINQEIDALLKLKPRIVPRSSFGDDHLASIDLQIKVLRGELDEDAICDLDGDAYSEASEALNWMVGTENIPPSEQWKDLIL